MNEAAKAAILGVVQGLTEFLPVSSSGHLEIGKAILGSHLAAEESMLMTVVLHAATALSTLIVFRKDVYEILSGLLKFQWNDETQFAFKVVLSMIPAVIVGLCFEDEIERTFGNLGLVGLMLWVTALLLLLADRARDTKQPVGIASAFVIGVAQAIAILPGVSRSGATISTSVLLGIDRMRAARFSFLMVVPLILGKMCKDLLDDRFTTENADLPILAIGFVAAFVTGIVACNWMIGLVRSSKLWWFSIYCFVVGLLALGFHLFAQNG